MGSYIKCTKCGYEWDTKANTVLVTCPSCNLKVKNAGRKKKQNNAKTRKIRNSPHSRKT